MIYSDIYKTIYNTYIKVTFVTCANLFTFFWIQLK